MVREPESYSLLSFLARLHRCTLWRAQRGEQFILSNSLAPPLLLHSSGTSIKLSCPAGAQGVWGRASPPKGEMILNQLRTGIPPTRRREEESNMYKNRKSRAEERSTRLGPQLGHELEGFVKWAVIAMACDGIGRIPTATNHRTSESSRLLEALKHTDFDNAVLNIVLQLCDQFHNETTGDDVEYEQYDTDHDHFMWLVDQYCKHQTADTLKKAFDFFVRYVGLYNIDMLIDEQKAPFLEKFKDIINN